MGNRAREFRSRHLLAGGGGAARCESKPVVPLAQAVSGHAAGAGTDAGRRGSRDERRANGVATEVFNKHSKMDVSAADGSCPAGRTSSSACIPAA
ncbi:hypothetical protein BGLA2_810065 [Burkholderia gladioli]|nr:hypothetical protein BGLA2_810065 [Burkholderia gladioli]